MTSNHSAKSVPAVLTRQLLVRSAILSAAAIVLLFTAILIFGKLKTSSYARLSPIGVSLELSYMSDAIPENTVMLEYDYGYGFIPAHRQSHIIRSAPELKVVEFSISSWKAVRALRLSVMHAPGVNSHAITFTNIDQSTRVMLTEPDADVLYEIDDVAQLFSELPPSRSGSEAN